MNKEAFVEGTWLLVSGSIFMDNEAADFRAGHVFSRAGWCANNGQRSVTREQRKGV